MGRECSGKEQPFCIQGQEKIQVHCLQNALKSYKHFLDSPQKRLSSGILRTTAGAIGVRNWKQLEDQNSVCARVTYLDEV